jgi:hypothetical protein
MDPLFLHGRKITAKGAKNGSSLLGPKAARNFLAELHHPQIRFRLIVIKRHRKIL